MTVGSRRSAFQPVRPALRVVVACALVIVAIAGAGCGSSKPAFCSTRKDLESSVKGLTSLNVASGVSGLQSQLQKIESNARKLVSQAKSDFPSETQAIKSSLDSLATAVKGLPSSPSAGQIASIAADASKFVSSVNSFNSATKSKCG